MHSYCWGGILNSCKKDTPEKVATQNISDEDLVIANSIVSFHESVIGNKKSTQTYTIDEAVLLMEGSVNYFYGYGIDEDAEFVVDSTFIPICIENGEVTSDEAAVVFNNVLNSFGDQLDNIGREIGNLALADLELVEDNGDYYLLVQGAFCYTNTQKSATYINDIDPDDWWYAFLDKGKCGNYSGFVGKDASDLMVDEVNNAVATEKHSFQYWWDVKDEKFHYADYPENSNNNYDYKIVYYHYTQDDYNGTWPTGSPCLSPTNIQYYTNELIDIVTDFLPTGRKVINVEFNQFTLYTAVHRYYIPKLYYGYLKSGCIGEAALARLQLP